jgi:2-haloacid dehalogenase
MVPHKTPVPLEPLSDLKAMIFDVFGTLVDWRTSIAREAEVIIGAEGYRLDWLEFADAWRAEYQPAMEEVRAGRIPFCKLDVLHRRNLEIVLQRYNIPLQASAREQLNLAWHRLRAWPDVAAGLRRLRGQFCLAPCSNGNISLMVDLARKNDFSWDAVLGAEFARDYKPKAIVYQAAAAAFDALPAQTLMVAAHSSDLAAAASAGLKTAFIRRPDEFGPGKGELIPGCPVDIVANDLLDLAAQFGT